MNVASIRQKVERAISKAQLTIAIYRPNLRDDGCGGYVLPDRNEYVLVAHTIGILDNSSSTTPRSTANPGGRVDEVSAGSFITTWQEGITFQKDDFFELDGIVYTISNPVNVLNMNIYWQLDLIKEIKGGR